MVYLKPLPRITESGRPFWTAAKEHQFLAPRCQDCGDYNWPMYPACRTCLSEHQVWTPVSGRGNVYSYSIVYRGPGAFDAEVPYVVALIELVESPRSMLVLGNLVTDDVQSVHIGQAVVVSFEDIPDEDISMYRFVPANTWSE